jgi:hypothetical protein
MEDYSGTKRPPAQQIADLWIEAGARHLGDLVRE